MYFDDSIEFFLCHFKNDTVPEYSGIVNHNVDPAEFVYGSLDDIFTALFGGYRNDLPYKSQ